MNSRLAFGILVLIFSVTAVGLLVFTFISPETPLDDITRITTASTLDVFKVSEFTPALYITNDYFYGVPENNVFETNKVWFYARLDNLTLKPFNDKYNENYLLFLSIVDINSSIYYNFNNTLIYNKNKDYSEKNPSEVVKFSLNVRDFDNGLYYVRLSALDLNSNKTAYFDNYFELK